MCNWASNPVQNPPNWTHVGYPIRSKGISPVTGSYLEGQGDFVSRLITGITRLLCGL